MSTPQHKTLRRLTYFAAIAKAGSIRAAARELSISVPVLSNALSELEDELGLSLATRSTRSFQLTSAGEAIYTHVQTIQSHVDAVRSLATTDRQLDGQLGITLPIELTASWLPERLARYRLEYPKVKLSIDARDEVVELRDTSIDIAVRVNFSESISASTTDEHLELVCVSAKIPQYTHETESTVINMPFLICPGNREWIGAVKVGSQERHLVRGCLSLAVSLSAGYS
ncbi:MAG: LysR family transcriptional regulator [Pseudomonadota bacterium]